MTKALGPAFSTGVTVLQRGVLVYGAGQGVKTAVTQFGEGDVVGGLLSLGQAGADLYGATRACFRGNMPMRDRHGGKPAAWIVENDELLSRDEHDPHGPTSYKRVRAVFTRVSPIWRVRVGDQDIDTTPEHPFYVLRAGGGLFGDQGGWLEVPSPVVREVSAGGILVVERPQSLHAGWVPAAEVRAGDHLFGEQGELLEVQSSGDTGEVDTVYNFDIEDYHTYFVGSPLWGFSVWAHNYNPDGQHGKQDHKDTVKKLVKKAQEEFAGRDVKFHQGTTIQNQPNTMGTNRRPDVWVVDSTTHEVLKVYEAARFNRNGTLVAREVVKQNQYNGLGLPNHFGRVI